VFQAQRVRQSLEEGGDERTVVTAGILNFVSAIVALLAVNIGAATALEKNGMDGVVRPEPDYAIHV